MNLTTWLDKFAIGLTQAKKMNQISSLLFRSSQLFFTVLLTVLNENTAKVKTPQCGRMERHIYSQMWRVRPLQLITASHSWVIGLAFCWYGLMMHNPSATYYILNLSFALTPFSVSTHRCGTNTQYGRICGGLWFQHFYSVLINCCN